MRKLALCLALTAVSLFLADRPSQAIGIVAPYCQQYCCFSSSATPTSKCWFNSTLTTCGAFLQQYVCP